MSQLFPECRKQALNGDDYDIAHKAFICTFAVGFSKNQSLVKEKKHPPDPLVILNELVLKKSRKQVLNGDDYDISFSN